jgi:hypothetical protein
MQYCRQLTFPQDPNYQYIYQLFEGCQKRNNFEVKLNDFIWLKNRLDIEKQAIKAAMLQVLKKPAQKNKTDNEKEKDQGQ